MKKLLKLFLCSLLMSLWGTLAAQNVVTGTITDENGEPLPGAIVRVQGSTRSVSTDIDGSFTINVKPEDVLEVSFLGYEPQTIAVGEQKEMAVQLKPKASELDEVTVVAFAKQKKESVISSITTISPLDLKVPSSNLTTALSGRMAGMISYQKSGEPGADNAEFFIRGVTTFGYKKDPLILIDNIELSSDDLARLNVDDIASFSIMKDATATALYGARGANGVILVTTKEGIEGKAKVSLRLENSFSQPAEMIAMADPITYMRLGNEAVTTRNPLGTTLYSQSKIENTVKGTNPYMYPATDWYDELFSKVAINQRANISVNGGGSVARYYVAASFSQDNGLLKTDKQNNFNNNIDLKKYSIRSNININLTKTTELVLRVHGAFDDYAGPINSGDNIYTFAMKSNPVLFPKYYPKEGEYRDATHILFGNYDDGLYMNPYAQMVRGYKEYSRSQMLAQGELKQKFDFITKGLSARVLFNTSRYAYSDVLRYYEPFFYMASGYNPLEDTYNLTEINPDTGTEYLGYNEGPKDVATTTYIEASAAYNREFGNHGVSAMLVYTMKSTQYSNAGDLQKSLPYRNMGLSGRVTYDYGKRYFTEFNFGYNGSERFSPNKRYGFFPSVGVGYIISNEEFWKPLEKVVDKLKFKFTHGLVGNDAIGEAEDRFFYLSNLNMNNGDRRQYFGQDYAYSPAGITVTRYANDQITWETARKTNIGVELTLLRNLEIQADFFHEYRSNILMDRTYMPSTMGLTADVSANVGEASSRGIDLSVDYSLVKNNSFWLSGRGNFTYATSRYEVYEEPDYAKQGAPYRTFVGQSLNRYWGYIAERLFVDEADIANSPRQNFGEYMPGDIKYKDVNGDGQITELDYVFMGYPTVPEISFGFGISLGYKGFDLSTFFQGNARVSFWLRPELIAPFIDPHTAQQKSDMLIPSNIRLSNGLLQRIADDHWSESNRNSYAFWPRLSNSPVANNTAHSTWWMQDGSFFRMKSLEIGYSLPKELLAKIGVESLRVYVSGNNLFTLSPFKLWDPEMGDNGLGYPIQRTYNIGLTLNF
jgi:TonB-linked SusC/RagA family outer membrane protein